MKKQPLRFVLLCDSLSLARWQKMAVEEAIGHDLAEPVGVVIRNARPPAPANSKWQKRWKDRRLLLWRAFSRIYVERKCNATIPEDASHLFEGVPIIQESPTAVGMFGEKLTAESLNFIKTQNPDFLLRFGFGILKGEVLTCSRLGVWSFHHGDPSVFRGQPPGFWEIYNRAPVVGSILQVLTEKLDAGEVLHAGYFQPLRHSYAKTRDRIYFGSAVWLRRTCANVLYNGWPLPSRGRETKKGPVYRQPSNWQMAKFLWRTAVSFLSNQIKYKLYRQTWNCAVVDAPIEVVAGLHGPTLQLAALQTAVWMPKASNRFNADPFGYPLNDGKAVQILFEHFNWETQLGTIASCRFEEGKFGPMKEVLAPGNHLSYPFVLHRGGEFLFVPEHCASSDLSAYRLDHSGCAELKQNLLADLPLVDTTFHELNGKTWAFSTFAGDSDNTELHIHFADSLDGSWSRHPLNPVKTDVRSARPAGTLFSHDGKLYRPSQDSASHYGSGVTINEVITLNEHAYEEIPVTRVAPPEGSSHPYGLHTLSAVGEMTLIDGSINESRVNLR